MRPVHGAHELFLRDEARRRALLLQSGTGTATCTSQARRPGTPDCARCRPRSRGSCPRCRSGPRAKSTFRPKTAMLRPRSRRPASPTVRRSGGWCAARSPRATARRSPSRDRAGPRDRRGRRRSATIAARTSAACDLPAARRAGHSTASLPVARGNTTRNVSGLTGALPLSCTPFSESGAWDSVSAGCCAAAERGPCQQRGAQGEDQRFHASCLTRPARPPAAARDW